MNALTVQGLCKQYPGFRLEDVSFTLPQGCIMGFIGVNGAGKTTTLKAILGHIRPDAGRVCLFDQPFGPERVDLRQQIGTLSGGVDYYPRKRLRSITEATRPFFPQWEEDTYRACLRRFDLDEGKRPGELSAGMKVIYQLALALSHRAKLLLLDEPTSGLDPVSREELLELLLLLAREQGISVLFSTHITSDLEKCAQAVTYIQRGRILLSQPREALLARYRLVSGPPEQLEPLRHLLIGPRTHLDAVQGLILSDKEHAFTGCKVSPATLEDIMVCLEREAKA